MKMTDQKQSLFLPVPDIAVQRTQHSTGLLPSQDLRKLIRDKAVVSTTPIVEDQIQPTTIDLRLGPTAYRMRASFLPGRDVAVEQKVAALGMHKIDLTDGALLEKGCVYIVPLMESVRLGARMLGMANPKSSAGRLDIFTRLITDNSTEFDRIEGPYNGPLYAEVSPRAFGVLVRKGSRLLQLRLRRGSPSTTDAALRKLHEETPLVHGAAGDEEEVAKRISQGIEVTADLRGGRTSELVGFKAKAHTDLVDVDKVDHYDPADYWEPIHANRDGAIVLNPNEFHILASKQYVTVPPDHAAEMAPFNPLHGEFRVHYAGFFDPGFGYSKDGGGGSRAVLEVRPFEVPFLLEDGQVVGRLFYERLMAIPDKIYGADIGSSYQRQGLRLSKQFKR